MAQHEPSREAHAEEAQSSGERRFAAIFESVDAISIQGYRADGTVTYWNPASERIYGYSRNEALGATLYELIIPPPMRDGVRQAVAWMFANKQGIPAARLQLQGKDGRPAHVYSSHTVVEDRTGESTLFCLDADLSELAKTESALRAEKERAQLYLDVVEVVLVALDVRGVITLLNRKGHQVLGYETGDLLGKNWFDHCVPKEEINTVQRQFQRIMAGEIQPSTQIENSVLRRDGGLRVVNWRSTVLKDEHGNISGILSSGEDITARKHAEAQVRQLEFFDPLTALPNRRMLRERLHQRTSVENGRDTQYSALLMLDLDNFKDLNDTQGHERGDRLLIEVAHRLTAAVGEGDTVSRLGGDEYVVVTDRLGLDASSAARQARAIAERIRAAVNEPYALQHDMQPYRCTTSIGVTLFQGHEPTVNVLLKQADVALYEAKNAGRNTIRFFNQDMQATIDARARLESALHLGIDRGELRLYYQPQVDEHGKIFGAEALLRWFPSYDAPVSPKDFIPLAEDTGLIIPMGLWVLNEACAQLKRWKANPETANLTISVNVSARQFHQTDFVDQVVSTIAQYRIDPSRLKLELTESLILSRAQEVIQRMHILKAQGVGFSLDDFGTGYSSLSYLKRLPLDQIKIDQSFVRDISHDQDDVAIVKAIIAMCTSLGLTVIAEGVETARQMELLQQFGCRHFQGYLFGRPTAIGDFPLA